jgi:hypothetical protein
MTAIPAIRAQLEKAKREEEIIRITAEQVVRDFARFGLEVYFSGKASQVYDELFDQLNQHIRLLMENQSGRLEALLYQIDVDQKKASRIIGGKKASEELTELILERELLKVLTRLYFKEKPPPNL